MRCLLFPGQGVQRRGMGGDVFEEFQELTAAADEILGYSIEELCLRDERRRLRDTRYVQPAVFFVNALHALRHLARHDEPYEYFAGHSLGEYNALAAAGCLDVLEGLALVKKRAELMANVTGGGMAAVIGLPAQVIERVIQETGQTDVHVANYNSDRQTTIAGDRKQLAKATSALATFPGVRVVPINVSGPFHSPLMEPAAAAFSDYLRNHMFKPGNGIVVSSVTGEPFPQHCGAGLLSRQLTGPVQWVRAIRFLRTAGVAQFVEINGTTLTSMIEGIS
ncbi:ACP S-malonyltransferase [Microbispora sp. NPDC046933]|uniref:ACP S-malonyltransferase n=1 Tax=Microbispora sp. NPDC046933 TaxID=3155618 RepID=UPI0033EF0153